MDKEQDPNLQSPQDANTTKHINFMEIEEADAANTDGNTDTDNDSDNPTKKAWEELRKDNESKQTSTE